jgi:hypothetical protein
MSATMITIVKHPSRLRLIEINSTDVDKVNQDEAGHQIGFG